MIPYLAPNEQLRLVGYFERTEEETPTAPFPPMSLCLSRHTALNIVPHIHNLSDAPFVAHHHRAFGSPSISTLIRAARAGYLRSKRNQSLCAHKNFRSRSS